MPVQPARLAGAAAFERHAGFHELRQIGFAEVLLGIEERLEDDRLGFLRRGVGRRTARLLLPIRDRLLVAHDLDLLLLKFRKGHPPAERSS